MRVKGSPDHAVSVAEIAASTTIHGKGSGPLPDSPPVDASSCVGRLGFESFLAPQLFTHAVRVKVDRETGVVRVLQVAAAHDSGRILNKIGADGQVYGGIAMGIGLALSEGTILDDQGRQRNPHLLDYKLVTAPTGPRSTSTGSRSTRRTPGRTGRRAWASRRACRRRARSRTRSPP